MKISLNNKEIEVQEGINLLQLIIEQSPYGEDAVVCNVNGLTYRSIDDGINEIIVKEGDNIEIFPLVIGG